MNAVYFLYDKDSPEGVAIHHAPEKVRGTRQRFEEAVRPPWSF